MIDDLIRFIGDYELKSRLLTSQDFITPWNNWITIPEKGYLDIGIEPYSINEIKAIDIIFVKEIRVGRLVKPILKNLKIDLEEFILRLNLKYDLLENNIIRVYLPASPSIR
jgi:hypothetical protein